MIFPPDFIRFNTAIIASIVSVIICAIASIAEISQTPLKNIALVMGIIIISEYGAIRYPIANPVAIPAMPIPIDIFRVMVNIATTMITANNATYVNSMFMLSPFPFY